MTEYINGMLEQYSLYTGTGIFMGLFFVALIYMAITEKNLRVRSVLLYSSISTLIFIFIPFTYYFYINYVDESTYWRLWWIVPSGIILSYVGAQLVSRQRATGLMLMLFIFAFGGKFVYASDYAEKMENLYQLPQEVVEVCDALEEVKTTGKIRAAFPEEFLEMVRQYDVNILMPYGREQFTAKQKNGFYLAMGRDTVDFTELARYCRLYETEYIVVPETSIHMNSPEKNGFEALRNIAGYIIYRYGASTPISN